MHFKGGVKMTKIEQAYFLDRLNCFCKNAMYRKYRLKINGVNATDLQEYNLYKTLYLEIICFFSTFGISLKSIDIIDSFGGTEFPSIKYELK